jgi:hypothetical protein
MKSTAPLLLQGTHAYRHCQASRKRELRALSMRPPWMGNRQRRGCGWDAAGDTLQGYGRGCLSRWSWGWLASPSGLSIDEKALGVGVAAVALALRAPVLLAALVTALARLFLG